MEKPKSFKQVKKIVKKIDSRLDINKNRFHSSYFFFSEDPPINAALCILQETTVNVDHWNKLSIYEWEIYTKNIIDKIEELNN